MKRPLLTILLFLLLGFLANVAVAWGCALFVGPQRVLAGFPGGGPRMSC